MSLARFALIRPPDILLESKTLNPRKATIILNNIMGDKLLFNSGAKFQR